MNYKRSFNSKDKVGGVTAIPIKNVHFITDFPITNIQINSNFRFV